MTREEAIQRFEKMKADADRHVEYFEGNFNVQSAFRKTAEMYNIALSALREQEERENAEPQAFDKPLTIEELREMDGERVWDNFLMEWCVVRMALREGKGAVEYFEGGFNPLSEKRFYRRKPEEELK